MSAVDNELRVRVTDVGRGLDPGQRWKGLGLRGIDERVKELQGTMVISRGTAGGTTVLVSIPVPVKEEVPLATCCWLTIMRSCAVAYAGCSKLQA